MAMMDQYKQETSQIHAPADLIRRTKEAMQREELCLQQAQPAAAAAGAGSMGADMQDGRIRTADRDSRRSWADRLSVAYSGRIYRWALPVAAAAMVLLLINITSGMVGNRFRKSASDSAPMEAAIDDAGAYETAEEEAFDDADMAVAGQKYSEGTMADQGADLYGNMNAGAVYDNGTDMTAAEDSYEEESAEAAKGEDENIQKEAADGAVMNSEDGISGDIYAVDLSVTEVAEAPAFVDDEDTECIMVHGIRVYVARETSDQWSAYARVNQVNYVVTGGGNIADAEDYAIQVYERLVGNADGAKQKHEG